jgi:hypothetical protein
VIAYVATLIANTVRISTALRLQRMPSDLSWLSNWMTANQRHRLEGIFVYFGFLLLLFLLSERTSENFLSAEGTTTTQNSPNAGEAPTSRDSGLSEHASGLIGRSIFPLLIYYATTLGIPLANGAYHRGGDFWQHSLFVLLTPLALVLPFIAFRFYLLTIRFKRDAPSTVSVEPAGIRNTSQPPA